MIYKIGQESITYFANPSVKMSDRNLAKLHRLSSFIAESSGRRLAPPSPTPQQIRDSFRNKDFYLIYNEGAPVAVVVLHQLPGSSNQATKITKLYIGPRPRLLTPAMTMAKYQLLGKKNRFIKFKLKLTFIIQMINAAILNQFDNYQHSKSFQVNIGGY